MKALKIMVEVTTLLIPGLNDSREELSGLTAFIADELGAETPWHVSRFHPTYRLTDRHPTPVSALRTAHEIGVSAGLHHIYMGNVPGQGGENTHCHQCEALLVERTGFYVRRNNIRSECCPRCRTPVYGIEMSGMV